MKTIFILFSLFTIHFANAQYEINVGGNAGFFKYLKQGVGIGASAEIKKYLGSDGAIRFYAGYSSLPVLDSKTEHMRFIPIRIGYEQNIFHHFFVFGDVGMGLEKFTSIEKTYSGFSYGFGGGYKIKTGVRHIDISAIFHGLNTEAGILNFMDLRIGYPIFISGK